MANPYAQAPEKPGSSRAKLVVPIVVDIVAPVGLYYILKSAGLNDVLALTVAGLIPAVSVIFTAVAERRLDSLAVLVLLMVVASLALTLVTGDAKFALAKESFFTAAAGIWCLLTLTGKKPIMYYAARPFATRGKSTREKLWEPTWNVSPEFRTMVKRITLAWAVMFLADSVARIIVIQSVPVDKAVFQSQLPGIVLLVATFAFTRHTGSRIRKLLDARAENLSGSTASRH
jgi:intracellular septation protein A